MCTCGFHGIIFNEAWVTFTSHSIQRSLWGASGVVCCLYIRRNSCEYPKVQRGPSTVLTKRLRALQSVRFRARAGTSVIGCHVLRLAPRVQRISMPRSPLSKIKDQGGCERSVCFHQKLCESRRRAARGCTSCCFPIFVAAYFLHFRFSAWWLSIHNNFSTSAAICALGDYVGDRNRVTG